MSALPTLVVLRDLTASTDAEVISLLASSLEAAGAVTRTFARAVIDRERKHPTGLATTVPSAIPHTDPEHVVTDGIAIAILAQPVAFGAMGSDGDTIDVDVVVMMLVTDASRHITGLQDVIARLNDGSILKE